MSKYYLLFKVLQTITGCLLKAFQTLQHLYYPCQTTNVKKTFHMDKRNGKRIFGFKNALVSSSALSCPNSSDVFVLDTDPSKFAIRAVPSQKDCNGMEKVIHFASNSLSKAEQKCCAMRRELHYISFFRHYLLGKKFVVRTDHRSMV